MCLSDRTQLTRNLTCLSILCATSGNRRKAELKHPPSLLSTATPSFQAFGPPTSVGRLSLINNLALLLDRRIWPKDAQEVKA
jgi:hypothetical protein